jgi:prepilin-type N-terminal cleavage/methylation domain-containing protein
LLRHNAHSERGFTLVELVVTMTITLIVGVTFYTFFKTNFFQYLNLQKDASSLTNIATQAQRVANVIRGTTSVVSADSQDLVVYAYFYPSDAYVSLVHYYLNAGSTVLFADVTPMTANPPIGTQITASKKTYTIIDAYKQTTGVNLFQYLDSANSQIVTPVSDLNTVSTVIVNLATPTTTSNQAISLQVNLRNKKVNL